MVTGALWCCRLLLLLRGGDVEYAYGPDDAPETLSLADNLENANNVSGKFGGVAGVFAGVII